VDHLRGLKENVTMGRLIPAGTGFEYYRPLGRRSKIVPPFFDDRWEFGPGDFTIVSRLF
jgi:hypothetical protein